MSPNDQVIQPAAVFVNLSPDGFHLWATHYYKCRQDFVSPTPFSPVPYFLLCRATELELKSRHLQTQRQSQVKKSYGHNLAQAYNELPAADQVLIAAEQSVLQQASAIYASKGFEYWSPDDALTGYRRFPDLVTLEAITKKLLGM